jgi:diaminobutyrate-2-oxoglutarate transaminase
METSGPDGEVMKLLPPLTLTDDELTEGLAVISASIKSVLR